MRNFRQSSDLRRDQLIKNIAVKLQIPLPYKYKLIAVEEHIGSRKS
jgi:hypothetical protein